MAEELRCPYCERSCSSASGLTNHVKGCKSKIKTSDPRDVDPRASTTHSRPATPAPVKQKPAANGFDIGAFLILGEHVPILLDLNFAAALAAHILKNGSENRAILAFGHQLSKVSGES